MVPKRGFPVDPESAKSVDMAARLRPSSCTSGKPKGILHVLIQEARRGIQNSRDYVILVDSHTSYSAAHHTDSFASIDVRKGRYGQVLPRFTPHQGEGVAAAKKGTNASGTACTEGKQKTIVLGEGNVGKACVTLWERNLCRNVVTPLDEETAGPLGCGNETIRGNPDVLRATDRDEDGSEKEHRGIHGGWSLDSLWWCDMVS